MGLFLLCASQIGAGRNQRLPGWLEIAEDPRALMAEGHSEAMRSWTGRIFSDGFSIPGPSIRGSASFIRTDPFMG